MGIFDRFKKASEQRSASTAVAWLMDCGITPDGYRRLADCPEVSAAADVYANLISTMTVHLMANGELGDTRVTNALSRLVDIAPNPWMTKQQFYRWIVRAMLLGNGNATVVPVFERGTGLIDRLVPLDPARVEYIEDGEGYYVLYDRRKEYRADEVMHFRIRPDSAKPWLGQGFRFELRDVLTSLKLSNKTKEHLLQSPWPSLLVSVDGVYEELASPEGREELARRFVSANDNGKPWIIPADGFKVESVKPLTVNDMAIRDGIELEKRQVAMLFGVPPFMLGVGDFDADAFNNFIRTNIRQLAKVIEEELTAKLLIKPEWYFRMNSRSLMAYSITDLVAAGAEMVDRTAMTRNEWRDWLGLSPRAEMEELIILENYLPIEQIGQQNKVNHQEEGGHE